MQNCKKNVKQNKGNRGKTPKELRKNSFCLMFQKRTKESPKTLGIFYKQKKIAFIIVL